MTEVADVLEAPLRATVLRSLGSSGGVGAVDAFLHATPDDALEAWFGAETLQRISPGGLRGRLDRDIAELDMVLSRAVSAVLHHPQFQQLEAAWRGVRWLTSGLGVDGMTVLRLLDCRWSELVRDLERAPEFDQNALFDKVYNQEFGMPGGVPFSMLVGLYTVQHRPTRDKPTDDVTAIRQLSAVAAAAFCPVILGADPALLGLSAFGELELRQSLDATFRLPEYSRFNSFQQTPDARFIGLALPRLLLRGPYRGRSAGDCGFRFEEATLPGPEAGGLWGNGVLGLAHIALRAFNEHRWLAAIRGTVQDEMAGGLVTTPAPVDFETDAPLTALKFAVEVNVTDAIDRELSDVGLIVFRRCKDTPYLATFNLPSAHKPRGAYLTEIARTNEQLGAMLNYVLCVSRFAHYIKVIGRNWIGSYKSAEECEGRLQRWIGGFCISGDQLSHEMKARYPLQSARVKVRETPGRPGSYECQAALKPHFEMDQAMSEFQLVTTIQGVERQL